MDQEVNEGQMVRFDCVVTGRPMPELFWSVFNILVNVSEYSLKLCLHVAYAVATTSKFCSE